ncbi:hypothetical protein [Christensenella massiliensis]|uniref:Phage tail tape measure protein n=1 Tax=Christensenella massiliensis TaxID=1805714 RepID=A0AAU8ABA6_9FIRM
MAQRIKGITVEIGGDTQPLNKALKDVSKTASSLNSELRVIDKLLKLDPTNTTLLAQKQEVLAKSIENTTKKLNVLKSAQEQAKAQLERGEIGADQYRALERQVISTENSLNRLQNEAQQTDEAFDKMGNAAQKSEKDMKSLSVGGVALGTVLGNVATKLLEFAGSAVTFLTDAVEETKEFRSDLSKLEQNAKAAGTGIDDVTDDLEYFVAITDETDSSVEALSNLLKAGFTGETLTDAVNNLSGAVVAFPDTLKIESLADSLQETLATGEATGQYGELLERLGVNLEDFNKGLQKCTTSAEKQQYAVDILAKNGMADLNAQYKEANADLIAYSTAQTRYTEMLSKVGAAMQPVMTALTDTKTLLLEGMIPALETTGQALSEKLASPSVQNSIKKIGEFLGGAAKAFADFAIFVIENGEVILTVVGSIAAGFAAWKISSIIGNVVKSLGTFVTAIKNAASGAVSAIQSINAASMSTIIGAIVTVVSLVISFASELGKASDEMEELKSASQDLSGSIEDTAIIFNESEAAYAATKNIADDLLATMMRYNDELKQGNHSETEAAAKRQMLAQVTEQYNSTVGGTAATINEATGLLNESTIEIQNNTDALLKNARAQAYQEAFTDIMREQVEIEKNRIMAVEAIQKNMGDLTEEQQNYINGLIEAGNWTELASEFQYSWNKELKSAGEVLANTVDQEELTADQLEYLTKVANENEIAFDGNTESVDRNAEAVSNLTEAQALQLLRMQENGQALDEEQTKQLDTYKAKNEEQYNSLTELVQKEQELQQKRLEILTNSNDAINYEDQISLKERIDNLNSNTQAVLDYESGLAELRQQAELQSNESMKNNMLAYIETLGDYSKDSMAIVSQMVADFGEGGGNMAWALANAYGNALSVAKPGMDAKTHEVGYSAEEAGGAGIASNDAMQTEFESSMQDTLNRVSDMIGENGPFYWLGIGIINRLASGMRDMAWKLHDVADNVVSTLKSKFNFEISVSSTGSGAKFQSFATGGIISREQIVRVAERGPEAIIPLDRLGGIIQGVLDNNGGGSGGNTYQLNVYTSDLSDGAQVRLFKNFSKWAGRRLD